MENVRMLVLTIESQVVNGRTYIPAHGMATLVHSEDVEGLLARGWRLADTPPPAPPKPAPPATDADLRRWYPLPAGEKRLRLLIPSSCNRIAFTYNGRPYASADGRVVDAPESDARALAANCGWMILGQVGTTEERPAAARQGDRFLDISIGLEVLFDGDTWRHPVTGEEV
jgi:hypothetical protein